jgi:hypothetical protein
MFSSYYYYILMQILKSGIAISIQVQIIRNITGCFQSQIRQCRAEVGNNILRINVLSHENDTKRHKRSGIGSIGSHTDLESLAMASFSNGRLYIDTTQITIGIFELEDEVWSIVREFPFLVLGSEAYCFPSIRVKDIDTELTAHVGQCAAVSLAPKGKCTSCAHYRRGDRDTSLFCNNGKKKDDYWRCGGSCEYVTGKYALPSIACWPNFST